MAPGLPVSARRRLVMALKSNLWAAAVALLIFGNFFIGQPEGYFFPVLKNLQILSVTMQKDGYLRYDITFDKARSCDALGGRIFYKAKGYYIGAEWKPDSHRYIISRLAGHQRASWQLSIPPAYYNAPIVVVGYHKCFGPLFWTTKTQQDVTYTGQLYYDTDLPGASQSSGEDQSPQVSQPAAAEITDSRPYSGEPVQ